MTTLSPPVSPQQHHDGRPRAISSMSYSSNRSRRSSHSNNKLDLVESAKDKKRLDTKADPLKALNEAQPAAVALEDSNLEDIRKLEHKDFEGNVITDPDRSNPTRYRLERPLDTIRAFNAAAEGTTTRRSSYQNRPASQYGSDAGNRRSTSYGNPNQMSSPNGRPRPNGGGYYRNSAYGVPRNESFQEDGPPQQYGRPIRYPSAPYMSQGDSPSSVHSHQHSYETMTSGSDEHSKSTNPSSQNSSFDRLHQMGMRKQEDMNHNAQYDQENVGPPTAHYGRQYPQHHMSHGGPVQHPGASYGPPPPAKPEPSRNMIKLTSSNSGPPLTYEDLQKAQPAKRQSWIKRRFSKRE